MMDASVRDWAEIPVHIVDLIVTKLDDLSDYSRFCGVCPQWRYTAHEVNPDYKVKMEILSVSRRKLPMLMFLTDKNSEKRSLFSIPNRKTYEIQLPLPYEHKFVGSSSGWLICVGKNMVLTLVNPCNNSCVSLPVFKCPSPRPLGPWPKKYFEYYFRKGILLSDSHSSLNGFEVACIYSGLARVAFFKSGSWSAIDLELVPNPDVEAEFFCVDIIFYKGKLYATNIYGKLVEIDTTCKTIKTIVPHVPQSLDDLPDTLYLVESQDGELLLVKRFWTREGNNVEAEDLVGQFEENNVEAEDLDDENYSHQNSNTSDSEIDSSDIQRILDLDELSMTFDFKVFKMTDSLGDGCASWVEMDNIGKQALFIGDNHSVSVSTIEFPECLKNSIYFTPGHHFYNLPYAYRGVEEDARIFNLEDKSLHYHHILEDYCKYLQPPIWFVLNPQELNSSC